MMRAFYDRFIRPLSKDSDQAEREIVLNYLLVGIFALSFVALIDTILAPIISNEPSYPYRILGNSITVLFVLGLYFVSRYQRHHQLVAIILTSLIGLFGCLVAFQWGMLNTNSILLLSLTVVMAGVLIGARYSLYATIIIALILAYLQRGESTGRLHPDLSWLSTKPTPGDVIGFTAILSIIALVSWLFNRQMELSLKRAQRSERALQRQKTLLEVKAEKRAQQLEAAQLDKMQELYRFAELGRLSTALFHDLANHLSMISVDIEGLNGQHQSSLINRISQDVGHIDTIVQKVRQQIRGKNNVEVFNIRHEIDEVTKILQPAAEQASVEMRIEADSSIKQRLVYKGDVIRFRQIILNLVSNGIEAYPASRSSEAKRQVNIKLQRHRTMLIISVTDRGRVIPASDREKIFRPFYTTKRKGTGIGLFIAKQVVENDFHGTISVSSDKRSGTTFTVNLPKSYYDKAG